MSLINPKLYSGILQLSILGLTWALVWFAFVYYPKVINDYKSGKVPTQSVLKPVSATSKKFPIETPAYRITYEENSRTYYVFIQGTNLEEYVFNRDNAKLALKTALSVENLCNINVFYAPVEELKIPENFNQTDC
jgi:hypothetical protein